MPSSYEEESYGYKVDLEVFSGPLDLLLYLIREEEVEITDIPISRITDQYLAHIELMQEINVNVAGEFLVMAATLMEIKSRMLLPRPERVGEEEAEDPRADLIRQLLEYKRFKDAARLLASRAEQHARRFTRGAAALLGIPEREPDDAYAILLDEVSIWQLQAAFRAILSQTTLETTHHIVIDERPAVAYCNDLLDELRTRGVAAFRELFNPAAGRMELINAFLALLELIRWRRVRAEQVGHPGEIRIVLLDDTPVSEGELVQPAAPLATEEPAPTAPEAQAAPPEPQPQPFPPAEPALDEEEIAELDQLELPDIESIPEPTLDLGGDSPEARAAWRARLAEEKGRARRRAVRRRAKAPAPEPYLLRRRRIPSLLARFRRCRPRFRRRRSIGIIAPRPRRRLRGR